MTNWRRWNDKKLVTSNDHILAVICSIDFRFFAKNAQKASAYVSIKYLSFHKGVSEWKLTKDGETILSKSTYFDVFVQNSGWTRKIILGRKYEMHKEIFYRSVPGFNDKISPNLIYWASNKSSYAYPLTSKVSMRQSKTSEYSMNFHSDGICSNNRLFLHSYKR